MSTLREAALEALEALEFMADQWGFTQKANRPERWRAIDALRAALAQQEQADYPEEKLQAVAEYVANQYHVWYGVNARDIEEVLRQSVSCGLVSNPSRREWQSLSEEEIDAVWEGAQVFNTHYDIARAVEQALKERNT